MPRPIIHIYKTVGKRDSRVEIQNEGNINLNEQNAHILAKETDFASQAARQLNDKTDVEEEDRK